MAYLELTKPRLTLLALITAMIGFLLGTPHPWNRREFWLALLGTALIGAACGILNQVMEHEADRRMERTRQRPIPSGRVGESNALALGTIAAAAGILVLTLGCNALAGTLASLTLASYLFIYTPLKKTTAFCTLAGAIPGAIPPLIGWAAARGSLGMGAWFLFWIIFIWQLPHFLAIAWIHRADYARAGFKMLPVIDPDGAATGRQIVVYCMALIPVSLLPSAYGFCSWIYGAVALTAGILFLLAGIHAARERTELAARRLFLSSIFYLPVILITMTLERLLL
jgi:protoheme IX farnesyltransferase